MKRFISIVLIVSIVGSTTSTGELLKLPFLMEHYKMHKALHPDTTFLLFLHNHYVVNPKAESDNDAKGHAQLPYKTAHSLVTVLSPTICNLANTTVYFRPSEAVIFVFLTAKVFTRSIDIWQPPRAM